MCSRATVHLSHTPGFPIWPQLFMMAGRIRGIPMIVRHGPRAGGTEGRETILHSLDKLARV